MLERNQFFENNIDLSEKIKNIFERSEIKFLLALISIALIVGYFTGNIFGVSEIKQSSATLSNSNQSSNTNISSSTTVIAQKIKVYVVGEINKPGVYEIEINSRLSDLITLAGNATSNANLSKCNLASFVTDAMMITIPAKNQESITCTGQSLNVQPLINSESSIDQSPTSLVNLNTATQTQLEELPGIGPSYAIAIIDYRTKNGGYKSVTELQKVKGIGDKKYSDLKDLVTV